MKIDLHMHSRDSDGELSAEELVDLAVEKKLKVIAITDHEVGGGSLRVKKYAKNKGIEVVPGIEIGADDEELGLFDVHVVGLFLDLENKDLLRLSSDMMKSREIQKRKMVEKLGGIGYDISFDEVREEAGGVNYGRPHIASVLIRKYSEFGEMEDVFDRLLGYGKPADVRQEKYSLKRVIDIIHGAGGVVILAHPMLYDDFEKIIDRFVEFGGDGIEVDYFYENRKGISKDESLRMIERVRGVAREKGLIVSGGGDFHHNSDPHEIGDFGVSDSEFLDLRDFWRGKWKKG